MRLERLLTVARKEVLELRRDPFLLRVVLVLPLAMLLLFGYAVNFTFDRIPMAVLDASKDRVSRILIREFAKDGAFVPTPVSDEAALAGALRRGRAWVGVAIPAGALETLRKSQTLRLKVWLDGSNPVAAFQVQARLRQAIGRFNARVLAARALVGEAAAPPVDAKIRVLYNPDLSTQVFMVPGVVGLIMTQIAVLLTALAIVREKENRMFEALIATPVRPLEVVLGKTLPYLVLAGIDAALVLGVGRAVFGVPMRGSLGLLLAFLFFFVLGSLGVGILVSTLTRTQIQAIFAAMVYYLPAIFFSGLFFPIEGMPKVLQYVTYLVPLRYFLEAARGIMLKGLGLFELWPWLLALIIFGVGTLYLAARRFPRSLA